MTRGGNKIKLALYHNDLDITDETTPLTLSEAIGVPDTSPYWPLPGLPDKLVMTTAITLSLSAGIWS